ncbi:MAG TPA: discoidin domain-containing protein [Candidatus Defluviicoccus seviourii]|nr:discoidin domain-containing protein [Candidatus Defluviicoccus seviourii]
MPGGFFKRLLFFVSLVLAGAAGFFVVSKLLDGAPKAQLLSRDKPATQSNIYPDYGPRFGNDGVRETFFHTHNEENPFWQVDLGAVHKITQVSLFNRNIAQERALNCVILTSDDGKEWTEIYANAGRPFGDGNGAGEPRHVKVSAKGRYVRVQIKGKGILHLSEVEVFGY